MNGKVKNLWRKDITGLRALAVLPVLFFHAFPEILPGGFYGVDIFFVISGYLISGIIFRGLYADSFSFADFYCKRIKRIVPNLIAVFVFVLFVGWCVSTADEFRKIGANVSHSAFFYQNFTLMKENDYFDVLSRNNPLLHIWSLSIEEQFYLFFPLLCYLLWKFGKKSEGGLWIFVLMLTGISFLSCLLIPEQNVRFYVPFARFWELGVGICIAYAEIFFRFNLRNSGEKLNDCVSVLGLLLVLTAFFLPGSAYAPPPGLFSLVPVFGGGCLILASADALVNRTLLSWRWMTFVGLISYSLYLWHWPILAYVNIYFYNPDTWLIFVALLFSFPVSILAYRYVENPMRRGGKKSNKVIVFLLICGLCLSYLSGKVVREMNGFPAREMAEAMSFTDDWSWGEGLSESQINKNLKSLHANEIPEIVFVGDSHMQQYRPRILKMAKLTKKNVGFLTSGACMVSIGKNDHGKDCINAKNELTSLMVNPKVKVLVIGQMWGRYGAPLLQEGINEYNDWVSHFLSNAGDRRVFVLLDPPWDQSPNREFDIEKYLENRGNIKEKIGKEFIVSLPKDLSWRKGNEFVEKNINEGVIFIETHMNVCPEGKCDLKNYRDSNHLRSTYVEKNAVWIDQIFE